MTHCVYRHIRPDTNEVFYVGMGKPKRPYTNTCRNRYWNNIVNLNKGNFKVDILANELTKEAAEEKEREFILIYGRIVDGTGTLVNLHMGGDNHTGFKMPDITRERMSKAHKGNSATKDYIRITNGIEIKAIHKDSVIPEGWRKGEPKRTPYSEEFRKKASDRQKGKNNIPTDVRKQNSLGNKSAVGCFWVNDGINNKLLKPGSEVPKNFIKGRLMNWLN